MFGFIDKGGFFGGGGYTIPLAALSNTNDLLARESCNERQRYESGRVRESEEVKGKGKVNRPE